ncbi:bone morphogenetic protein 6-like [Cololabis saira]|uniref:bone morphogenetic protein 6-like n=1 Tax=Cololabis saira TaxID=129043 RepID=UPI002AD1FDFD|nr:bone morphogenetic protein 6-like [Cololabis saira]
MSFTLIVMMMLLGSSGVKTFVLEPTASAVSHPRCQDQSLETIRKSLLGALNLQTEPRIPVGMVDRIRVQWQISLSAMSQDTTAPALSVSPDGGNSADPKCCATTSEISMKDLGWDNWVIHPMSLTTVQCALCNPADRTAECPSSRSTAQDANSQGQLPCCQPTSQEMVPIVFMDETSTIVISSVQLTRTCGCEPGNEPGQPANE